MLTLTESLPHFTPYTEQTSKEIPRMHCRTGNFDRFFSVIHGYAEASRKIKIEQFLETNFGRRIGSELYFIQPPV
jgi:hypothetical protein